MAMKSRSRTWPSRLHFLLRFLGLTGLLAVLVGWALLSVEEAVPTWEAVEKLAENALQGEFPREDASRLGVYLALAGGAFAALALLVELGVLVFVTTGRRSFSGMNAIVQTGLAAALLAGVNVFSWSHYTRIDCTCDSKFTLPDDVKDRLRKLTDQTTIYVLQQRPRYVPENREHESYEAEAQNKVVEKIRDLVEQLRDFGPQFRVVVFNAAHKDFKKRVDEETRGDPELRSAIQDSPESSIIFHARLGKKGKERTHIQRIGFRDFYQLDLARSTAGEGNLVLVKKGLEPFTRRALRVEEKKPRIGVLVIDPDLSTESTVEVLTLSGMKNTLKRYGFEVVDIITKSLEMRGAPTADTLHESALRRRPLVAELIRQHDEGIKALALAAEEWRDEKRLHRDLVDKYEELLPVWLLLRRAPRDEVVEYLKAQEEALKAARQQRWEELKQLDEQIGRLDRDSIAEMQRINDVKTKLRRAVADCDLLLVPRLTRLNFGGVVAQDLYEVFRLHPAQVEVLQEFMAQGKPLMACLGPMNEVPRSPQRGLPPLPRGPLQMEPLEVMLAELGVAAQPQTILFDTQLRQDSQERVGADQARIPSLNVIGPLGDYYRRQGKKPSATPNPLRQAIQARWRDVGTQFELPLPYLRPITYEPENWIANRNQLIFAASVGGRDPLLLPALLVPQTVLDPPAAAPEFLISHESGLAASDPFTRPNQGPRGPVSVGVAVEAMVPQSWFPRGQARPLTTRLVVIGSGTIFADRELSPQREALLLESCRWLLRQDDLLGREASEADLWRYPRLDLAPRQRKIWLLATLLGLPVLCIYLGIVTLLSRRVR